MFLPADLNPLHVAVVALALPLRSQPAWKGVAELALWIAAAAHLMVRLLDASVEEAGWTAVVVTYCFFCYMVPIAALVCSYARAVASGCS